MSGNALRGNEPHTYLDDLESFFYAMIYITLAYTAPGCPKKDLPHPLSRWDEPFAADAKEGFIGLDFHLDVEVWFGAPFQNLLERLHSIFKNILRQKVTADHRGKPLPVVNHVQVYETMLSHIRQAIDDLSLESTTSPPPEDIGAMGGGGQEVEQPSTVSSQSRKVVARKRKRKRKSIVMTLASSRPRRKHVNYGITRVGGRFIVCNILSA
jgi:hypothetical protein